MNIQNIIVAAILIEALITYIDDWFIQGKIQWKQVISVVIGIALALVYQVDLPKEFGLAARIPFFGEVISGIVFSRGSNYVFDLMRKLSKKNTQEKADEIEKPTSETQPVDNDNFSEGRG